MLDISSSFSLEFFLFELEGRKKKRFSLQENQG